MTVAEAGRPAATAMEAVPCRIRRVARESAEVFTLELDAPAGAPAFAPGQFAMLYVFGVGEAAMSYAGDPARPDRLVHTVHAVGTVTTAMQHLRRGDVVGVRGPFGTGWPLDAAVGRDLLLVAGGLGMAPLRPVLHVVAARRAAYGNVALVYGSRSPDRVLYRRQLAAWARRDRVDVALTVDQPDGHWDGDVGVVTPLVRRAPVDVARTVAFVCGPEVMIAATVAALAARGIAAGDVFVSLERNMQCGMRHCGRCQLGDVFVCADGPVFAHPRVARWLALAEA